MASSLSFSNFSMGIVTNDTSLINLYCRLMMLAFLELTIGTFFHTVCYCVVPKYTTARMRHESDHISEISILRLLCWTLALSVGQF